MKKLLNWRLNSTDSMRFVSALFVLFALYFPVSAAGACVDVDSVLAPCSKQYLSLKAESEREKVIDSVISTLSTREKIAQLMIIEFSSKDSPKRKMLQNRLIKNEKIGGVIIMNDHLLPAVERLNRMHSMAPLPLLVTIDGEWGVSMRYPELLFFPRQMQLGALPGDSLVYEMGKAIGRECRDLAIHVNFVPDVDINNNPENPVINTRSFGENKEIVAKYALAYMNGLRSEGIYGSAKHFPGHGDTDVDSHKSLPVLNFSKERLNETELYPFRQMIGNGVDMVMVGHLEIPAYDKTGTPASISKPIITDLLKGELGYNGIVITDALNMKGVSKTLEKKMIPLEAFKAGVDILLMPEDVENSITEIEKALKRGEISMSELNSRLRKVLALKVDAGLFKKSYNPIVNTYRLEERMVKDSSKELIARLAENSVTVVIDKELSNSAEKRPALPLDPSDRVRIGYLGYMGDSFGKEFAETLLKYKDVDTVILRGNVTLHRIEEAVDKLSDCSLLLLGVHNTDSRPHNNFGMDSTHFKYFTQLAAVKDVIMVYMGSPYALNRIKDYSNFKGYVVGYANTSANNHAAAQLLFGGIAATGSLPVGTGEFKQGYSVKYPKQTLSYDYIYRNKRELSVADGRVTGSYVVRGRGDTLMCNVPVVLDDMAPLIAQLPLVGILLDENLLNTTSTLGRIIKVKNPLHAKILFSDILMHRSGLPQIEGNLRPEQIYDLEPASYPTLLHSTANIFYLDRILEEKYGAEGISERLSALYEKLGMRNTRMNRENGKWRVTTTLSDMTKYIYTISNGGQYSGKKIFSPETASFLQMLVTYYGTNSDGLSVMQTVPAGEYRFFYK